MSHPDRGFSLVELLVVMVIGGLLLAGLTSFYLSQHRAMRHHQIEVEASQGLRTALEQMTRDIRSARRDLTYDIHTKTGGSAAFLTAGPSTIEFTLDANDDGTITSTENKEHKGYRLSGTQVQQYDASTSSWVPLADNISALAFSYFGCPASGTTLDSLGSTVASGDLPRIVQVNVSITATVSPVGGLPVSRTETESIRLRNRRCT